MQGERRGLHMYTRARRRQASEDAMQNGHSRTRAAASSGHPHDFFWALTPSNRGRFQMWRQAHKKR
eukprot:2702299-Alexandrium_andersonii.AAC.1